jgi:hypothetical protein
MIDDAPGMIPMQSAFASALPTFVSVLDGVPQGLPNVHIGVVSTDMGSTGIDDAQVGGPVGTGPGSCDNTGKSGNVTNNGVAAISGQFVSDILNTDGTRTFNYSATLSSVLGDMVALGANGCQFGQPLLAAYRAVHNNPGNIGFVRSAAALAVIVVANEDDCTMDYSTVLGSDTFLGPLAPFRCTRFGVTCDQGGTTADAMAVPGAKLDCHPNDASSYLSNIDHRLAVLRSLKTDPRRVMVGAIGGAPAPLAVETGPALSPACTSPLHADPAVRLAAAASAFDGAPFVDTCSHTMTEAVEFEARRVKGMLGASCVERDIAMPADCVAVDQSPGKLDVALPPCPTTAGDCFSIAPDAATCGEGQMLRVAITRATTPATGTWTVVSCTPP